MSKIEVEKEVLYLSKEKLYSVSLYTKEPYGEYGARTIYISNIFHRKLEKALKMAWKEFYKTKDYHDRNDKMRRERQTETVMIES